MATCFAYASMSDAAVSFSHWPLKSGSAAPVVSVVSLRCSACCDAAGCCCCCSGAVESGAAADGVALEPAQDGNQELSRLPLGAVDGLSVVEEDIVA